MQSSPEPSASPSWKGRLVVVAKLLVFAVTIYAVGRHVKDAYSQLREQGETISIQPGWIAASAALYLAGLAMLGVPWWLVVRDIGQEPTPLGPSLRAYLISHLGKYVPGKAMSIIIRCGLMAPVGVGAGLVTLTTFYETFATMASGSILSLACLTLAPSPPAFAQAIASRPETLTLTLILAAGFGLSVYPPGFELFTHIVTRPFRAAGAALRRRVRFTVFLRVQALGAISWLLQGASYWAALNAVHSPALGWDGWPMATACVALSIVGGFVSMLPGGIGFREWILIATLKPVVGEAPAVAASLLFRVVTTLAEVAQAGVLYMVGGRQ